MTELAKGCSHFLEYRQSNGLQSFKIIYKYLVKPGQEARKLKVGFWSWSRKVSGGIGQMKGSEPCLMAHEPKLVNGCVR